MNTKFKYLYKKNIYIYMNTKLKYQYKKNIYIYEY